MAGERSVDLVDSFAGLRALVLGDAMLDVYLRGESHRLWHDAPVPQVELEAREEKPGGAANTAANLAGLGARVSFVSLTGDDRAGRGLRDGLEAAGVDAAKLLAVEGRRTLTKTRISAGAQILVRLDDGDAGLPGAQVEQRLIQGLTAAWGDADLAVVSDYAYGVMSDALVERLSELMAIRPLPLLVDARGYGRYRKLRPSAVKPNYDEAIALLGLPHGSHDRCAALLSRGHEILQATGAGVAAVTLDRDGALIFEEGCEPHRTYAEPVHDSQAAGAGDTFLSAFALALAAGAAPSAAGDIAAAAAGVVVRQHGTTTCRREDLLAALA